MCRDSANPTVRGIQQLGKKSIQTNRDKSDVLRHIIKNVSKRLVRLIESRAPVTQWDFFFSKKGFCREGVEEEMEGSDETCVFSAEGNEDTTMLVQIEEAKCTIRKLPFVTVLAPVRSG